MTTHDLLVVGGGAGNNLAAAAARADLDVGLVEKGPMGGACLTRGCDPSKTLLHRARVVEEIRTAEQFGVTGTVEDVDFERVVEESNRPFDEQAEEIEQNLREMDGLTLYKEEGRFVDERAFDVGGEEVDAETVILAVGGRPAVPDAIDGIDEVDFLTSDDALRLDECPDRLVVVGGGYVAAEIGYFFGQMGSDVTVVGRSDHLLTREDREVREAFTEAFREDHTVHTGREVSAVEESGDEITVRAESADDDGSEEPLAVTGDEMLLAAGRTPNSDVTNVEAGGVETDEKGYVSVDEHLQTSAENVWAFGDVIGPPLFRHTANHEGQTAFRNAVRGAEETVDYTGNAHAVFASPEVAAVGETERELAEAEREYVTGDAAYTDTPMGLAMKAETGFAKVLADPDDGAVLGCHVVGPQASTLIHEVVVALTAGDGTLSAVTDAIHVHPALNEVIEEAFGNVSS